MKKRLLVVLLVFVLVGCPAPTDSGSDGGGGSGDIPTPSLDIPAALINNTTSGSSSMRIAVENEQSVFEPFRSSLTIADELLTALDNFIIELNNSDIPDSNTEFSIGDGQYMKISYDGPDLSMNKTIEIFNAGSADYTQKFFEFIYTDEGQQGSAVYLPQVEDPTSGLVSLRLDFQTPITAGSTEMLTGEIIFDYDEIAGTTYPQKMYFRMYRENGARRLDGGVVYNYAFDEEDSTYDEVRAYMYKAVANEDGSEALVALYFPEAISTTINETTDSLPYVFKNLCYEWVSAKNPTLVSQLNAWYNANTSEDSFSILNADDLVTVINTMYDSDPTNPDIADILFILGLENPIAYSSTNGYEGNQESLPDYYQSTYLSSLTSVAGTPFYLYPSGLNDLTIGFEITE